VVQGFAQFVDYNGAVYQLVGYGAAANWAANQAAVVQALQSFHRLTDPAALAVQPQRIDIWTVPQRTTIATLLRQHPSPRSADDLALINNVDAGAFFASGQMIKWVVGQALPGK